MPIDLKNIPSPDPGKPKAKTEESFAENIFGLLNKDIKLWGKKLKDKKKESFYSELHILLTSGIDIRTALDIVVEEQKTDEDKKLFAAIKNEVVAGEGLSDAVFKTGKFSAYEYYSLKIGEESGRIKEVLADLTSFYSKKIKQQRQITSAMTYPVMVLVTAVLAVNFMLTFIVPMFVDVFKRFNGQIPALTKVIISISGFMRAYSWLMLLFLISIVVCLMAIRQKEYFRKWSSVIMLRLPLFGDLVKKVYLTRYCQSMALLLGAKTPMLKSLQLVKQMIGFYPFEKAMEKMEDDILHGKMLHQSMARFSFFDTRIISLVRVAEEVNQLENIFTKLNAQYSEEMEHRISMLSSLLEPVMIIIVGVLVAVILISMYLPLFQLSSSVY